jgi:hypothetical protein
VSIIDLTEQHNDIKELCKGIAANSKSLVKLSEDSEKQCEFLFGEVLSIREKVKKHVGKSDRGTTPEAR